jgi:Peptidase family S41
MDRRKFLTATGASAAALVASPAIVRAEVISSGSANDIAVVREILTTLHPGLYRYQSPKGIESGLKVLDDSWTKSPNSGDRYLALARFLATIKCGHSYPNFFNQSAAVKKELFDRPTRLPFTFKWVGEQMVVLDGSASGQWLPRGSIVKAINDVPAKTVLHSLLPFVRADGNNDAKRRALLSVSGADGLETFDVFHGLKYGARGSGKGEPPAGFHRLRYRAPGASRDVWVDVPVISLADRMAQVPQKPKDDGAVWDWTMRPDGIAVLKMDGWALFNSKWKWEDWLNERLDSLKGAKGLIIDIRENEGGLDCGDVILARLARKDIVKPTAKRLVRYDKVPANLNPYLDTWDNSFRDWGDQVERFDDRYFKLKKWEDGNVLAAKGPRIDTPVSVLTSAQNSSATFQFANLCKQSGLAKLVGETTGGNQRGINGGAFFFARLPESGLEFDVPLVGYFPEDKKPPDAGLPPDIAVAQTAQDIASGLDRALETAIADLARR